MQKIVIITGCLGFIGQWVTKACLERGWKVYGIDKGTYAADSQPCFDINSKSFKLIKEDICDLKRLPDCDYIINLAAESHVGNSIVGSSEFIKTNVDGVRNLLDLIKAKPKSYYGRPLLVHFSTDEVYGDIEENSFTEESALNPSNPYSASKAAGDMLIKSWSRTYDMDYVIIRPTNNYGLGQYPEKLIPLTVKLLQFGEKKIPLHNGGEPVRSWLHVEDTASAVMKILDNSWYPGSSVREVYNISGVEFKNKDVVRKIVNYYLLEQNINEEWDEYNYETYCTFDYDRPGQDVRYSVSDDKLRKLGWSPAKKFDEELPKIIDMCRMSFRW